jgi:hypothetical protein
VGTKFLGVAAGDIAGQAVAFVGDIDEDGLDDFLIGAYRAPGGEDDGAAYLIYGW